MKPAVLAKIVSNEREILHRAYPADRAGANALTRLVAFSGLAATIRVVRFLQQYTATHKYAKNVTGYKRKG
jgi:hypothetical protein